MLRYLWLVTAYQQECDATYYCTKVMTNFMGNDLPFSEAICGNGRPRNRLI